MSENIVLEELAGGRVVVQHCTACGHKWLPPRAACPSCLGRATDFREASGRGTILSWVTYHHAYCDAVKDLVPYTVAIVRLDEGPQILANMVSPTRPEIGGKVVFVPPASGAPPVYLFRSIAEDDA